MRRWQLWTGEGCQSFFPEDNEQARRLAQEDRLVFTWEVVAKGHNAAMRALHAHCGWAEYKPMLNEEGQPFPEDEDDDYVRPQR